LCLEKINRLEKSRLSLRKAPPIGASVREELSGGVPLIL
jgi:hypothetical protein